MLALLTLLQLAASCAAASPPNEPMIMVGLANGGNPGETPPCALRALAATQVCGGAHDRLRGQLERVAELLRFVRRPELPVSILK